MTVASASASSAPANRVGVVGVQRQQRLAGPNRAPGLACSTHAGPGAAPGPPCGRARRRAATRRRRPPARPARRARRRPRREPSRSPGPTGSAASGSPPCARIIARQASIARPSASAVGGSTSVTPAAASISRARATVSSTTSARPAAGEHLDRLAHLVGVAGGQAERRGHVGEQRHGRARRRRCRARPSSGPARARVSTSFMNAPVPTLTSSTSAPVPSAIFLLMIERGDQRDRLDRAGDVAQRVELAVGGGEAGAGRADDRADVVELAHHLVVASARRASRGSTRACRACRRCGRGRGRTAAAPRRRRPRRAAPAAA